MIVQSYRNTLGIILGCVFGVMALVGFLVYQSHSLELDRSALSTQAFQIKKQADKDRDARVAAEQAAAEFQADAARAAEDSAKWKRKWEVAVSKIPPPPPPVPVTDPELALALKAEGLSDGLSVVPEGMTTIVHQDASKALSWAWAAKRVPALEEAVATGQETVKTLTVENGTLGRSVAAQERLVVAVKAESATKDQTIQNLGSQVKVSDKQIRNQKIQKWVFTIVAGFLGYKAGRL